MEPVPLFTLSQLVAMPTLCEAQADNLKWESGAVRLWLSRCTVADGEPFDNAVTIEVRSDDGNWENAQRYPAPDLEGSAARIMHDWMLLAMENDGRAYVNSDPVEAFNRALRDSLSMASTADMRHLVTQAARVARPALVATLSARWGVK